MKCIHRIVGGVAPSRLLASVIVLAVLGLWQFPAVAGAGVASAARDYPERIVSLGPINTENVYLLGAGDRLVGNTRYCVRPEAAKKVGKVGTMLEVSVEKIIDLRPDIVLATGLTPAATMKQLQRIGIKVVQFDLPPTLAGSCEQFLELGRLLGLEQRAREIVDGVNAEIAAIQERVGDLPARKVFLQIGASPLYAAISDSFINDFIELANGVNVVRDQRHGRMNYEKVIAGNPEVIIIAIMGSETGVAGQEKQKWQKYRVIRAVQDDRIYFIDPDLACSPSPATFVEALRIIAGFIHPEADLKES